MTPALQKHGSSQADRLDPSTKASFSELLKEYTSMGFTFVAASGDDGAQGAGGNGSHFEDTAFASPYAVMVGATSWDPYKFPFPPCVEGARAQCPEVAAHCGNLGGISVISSGGGFASMYLRPSYQAEAVMRYLDWATSTGNLPGTGVMNPAGRGYPDVALLGVRCNATPPPPTTTTSPPRTPPHTHTDIHTSTHPHTHTSTPTVRHLMWLCACAIMCQQNELAPNPASLSFSGRDPRHHMRLNYRCRGLRSCTSDLSGVLGGVFLCVWGVFW